MGLRPAYDALARELKYDDGKPNWTLSRSDALAGDRERFPELSYEGTGGVVDGRLPFTFATSEAVVPGQLFFVLEEMVDLNAQFAAAFKILWRPGRILNS